MSKISPTSTTVILSDGQRLVVEEGDFPEVAKEVFIYFRTRMAALSDEIDEFLYERDEAAPSMVSSVRIRRSLIDYYVREWQHHHAK